MTDHLPWPVRQRAQAAAEQHLRAGPSLARGGVTDLPRPLLFDGTVTVDARERKLVVRPASHARPLARVLWSEAARTLAEESRTGRQSVPTPWASGAGRDKICYGVPGTDGSLKFHFYPGQEPYRELVSTPGLRARIALDRTSGRISVTFRGRR